MVKHPFLQHPQYSRSTSSLQTLPRKSQQSTAEIHPQQLTKPFEYEDIIYGKKTSIQPYKLTDILARESDVTISNQITPLTEYKGYALYLLVSLFHGVWLLWTFLPKSTLNMLGVYYYPSRWWSLCSSSIILMGMLYTYLALMLFNIEYQTADLDELRTIIDEDAVIERDVDKYGWEVTNGVFDLRVTDVNRVLYDIER